MDYLREIVGRAYTRQEHITWYRFYKSIRETPWFRGPAGELYKLHVLLWLVHAPEEETLLCTGAGASFPDLQLPSCPKDPKCFLKPKELEGISEPENPQCLIPTSKDFPTLDAIVLTSDAVITVQITISPTHDAKEKGFGLIYDNLPSELLWKRPNRYHLFITDEKTNAKSLREQKLKEIPANIGVYSTVASVQDMESKAPMTYGRVIALEKAREPPADMMEVTWE